MADRLQRIHPHVGVGVVLPADPRFLQLVGQHLDVDARPGALPVGRDLQQLPRRRGDVLLQAHDPLDVGVGEVLEREPLRVLLRVVAVVALGVGGRLVVDDPVGLRRHRVQVLGERRAEHRREEPVGHHEPVRVRPVGGERIAIVLDVSGEVLAQRDAVVAVHLAAVDREQSRIERVPEVVGHDLRRVLQRDGLGVLQGRAVQRAALRGAVDARIATEVVIEAPVLLDHENDVLDRVLAGHDHADPVPPVTSAAVAVLTAAGRPAAGLLGPVVPGPHEPHQRHDEHQHGRGERATASDVLLGGATRAGRADERSLLPLHDAAVYPSPSVESRESSRPRRSTRAVLYAGSSAMLRISPGSGAPSAPVRS